MGICKNCKYYTTKQELEEYNRKIGELPTIPENSYLKFIVSFLKQKACAPQKIRIEKFLPPPITQDDLSHICKHKNHIYVDKVKGEEWYRCCAVFNRFEECLFFEEAAKNNNDTTGDEE